MCYNMVSDNNGAIFLLFFPHHLNLIYRKMRWLTTGTADYYVTVNCLHIKFCVSCLFWQTAQNKRGLMFTQKRQKFTRSA